MDYRQIRSAFGVPFILDLGAPVPTDDGQAAPGAAGRMLAD
jgi:hypothetical protein